MTVATEKLARVKVVDGFLVVRFEYLGLSREDFRNFLFGLLRAMGFAHPELVQLYKPAKGRVNWSDIRIPAEEFEIEDGLEMEEAAARARAYLEKEAPKITGFRFRVL